LDIDQPAEYVAEEIRQEREKRAVVESAERDEDEHDQEAAGEQHARVVGDRRQRGRSVRAAPPVAVDVAIGNRVLSVRKRVVDIDGETVGGDHGRGYRERGRDDPPVEG